MQATGLGSQPTCSPAAYKIIIIIIVPPLTGVYSTLSPTTTPFASLPARNSVQKLSPLVSRGTFSFWRGQEGWRREGSQHRPGLGYTGADGEGWGRERDTRGGGRKRGGKPDPKSSKNSATFRSQPRPWPGESGVRGSRRKIKSEQVPSAVSSAHSRSAEVKKQSQLISQLNVSCDHF